MDFNLNRMIIIWAIQIIVRIDIYIEISNNVMDSENLDLQLEKEKK